MCTKDIAFALVFGKGREGENTEYEEYRCDSYAVIAQRNHNAEWHVYVTYRGEPRHVSAFTSKELACAAAYNIAEFAGHFATADTKK